MRHRQVTHSEAPGDRPADTSSGALDLAIGQTAFYDAGRLSARTDVRDETKRRRIYRTAKRLLDVILASIGLIVLLPAMAVIAVLIKLDSRGPVLFTHRREGREGREFSCFKFRTMHVGAHRLQRSLYRHNMLDGPQFKMLGDPRVTRIGRLLRETNLDELPQFINVVLGHLSLVGPRPSPFRENQICIPWRRARLSVRPGITGLWQLCRCEERAAGDFQQWIFYDLVYVRRRSLWLDLKILMATALTLGGRWRVPIRWMTPTEPNPYMGANQTDSHRAAESDVRVERSHRGAGSRAAQWSPSLLVPATVPAASRRVGSSDAGPRSPVGEI